MINATLLKFNMYSYFLQYNFVAVSTRQIVPGGMDVTTF